MALVPHNEAWENEKTQNSGVTLDVTTQSYASVKDKMLVSGDVTYYRVVIDIFKLRYSNDFKFVLFNCDWIDNNVGVTKDEFDFTMVSFKHVMYKNNRISNEPFILASQAKQCWYVPDPVDEDWHIVMRMTARDLYDMPFNVSNNADAIIDQEV